MNDDICKICRCPATRVEPLIHPCKCTGSVGSIHEDCLAEWIRNSYRDHCEICLHPFNITFVYEDPVPKSYYFYLYFERFKTAFYSLFLILTRIILVLLMWFIVIPYFAVFVWRAYFLLGRTHFRILEWFLDWLYVLKFDNSPSYRFYSIWKAFSALITEGYLEQFTTQNFMMDCFKGQAIIGISIISFYVLLSFNNGWNITYFSNLENVDSNEDANIISNSSRYSVPFQTGSPSNESFSDGPPSPVARLEDFSPDTVQERENIPNFRCSSAPPSIYPINSDSDSHRSHYERRAQSLEPSILYVLQSYRYMRSPTSMMPGAFPDDPREYQEEVFQDTIPDLQLPAQELLDDNNENNAGSYGTVLQVIGIKGSLWDLPKICCRISLCVMLWLTITILLPYILGTTFILTGILVGNILSSWFDQIFVYIAEPTISYLKVLARHLLILMLQKYLLLPSGETAFDRIGCITLGYIVACISAFVAGRLLNNGNN